MRINRKVNAHTGPLALLPLLAASASAAPLTRQAELVERWSYLSFHDESYRDRTVDADYQLLDALQASEAPDPPEALGAHPSSLQQGQPGSGPPFAPEHPWLSVPRHRPEWHPPTLVDDALPDRAHRLLAVARLWAAMRWAYPYAIDPATWRAALPDALDAAGSATTPAAYHAALETLLAHQRDGHGAIEGPGARAVRHTTPFALRSDTSGGAPFVLRLGADAPAGLKPGDRLVAVDGVPWRDLAAAQAPRAQGGTDASWMEDRDQRVLEALDGVHTLTVERRGRHRQVESPLGRRGVFPRPHPLPARVHWRTDGVHVIDLQRLPEDGLEAAMSAAADADALLFDLRGYPPYLPQQLVSCISAEEVVTHRFDIVALDRPGEVDTTVQRYGGAHCPGPRFDGPVAVLLDRHTFSRGEYIAMALEAVPRVLTVGEPTAGADGDRVGLPLPGRVTAWHSGLGIRWPDGRPTQRVGIVPDVDAPVTRRGVRRGRDEPMEAALEALTSP